MSQSTDAPTGGPGGLTEELVDKVTKAGRHNDGTPGDAMVFTGKGYAHGLHAPYWWIKSAVGVTNDDHPLAKAYHKLLVWEIMKQPRTLQLASKVLDPLIGKSLVLYFRKPDVDAGVVATGSDIDAA